MFAQLTLSGDKSVSIRRALLSLYTTDPIRLTNYGAGEDCETALLCLESLGKKIERGENFVTIKHGPLPKSATLDCRNSGTTARLLMGLLAGRAGEWTLIGDDSLSKRPMERVADPLRNMGAQIDLSPGGFLPARIAGGSLRGTDHNLKISSAQVKSALLLAGLSADGITRVREPIPSRDHTERLLTLTQDSEKFWCVDKTKIPDATLALRGTIPGDISSSAFWAVASLLIPQSDIELNNVVLNPTRTSWIQVLKNSGANISEKIERTTAGEPAGSLHIKHSSLSPLKITPELVPGLIDELPALAVLAATIPGESVFEKIGELRVKESDRLMAIVTGLSSIRAAVEVRGENLHITGGKKLIGAKITPNHDHRIAMAFALAGLVASGATLIEQAECAAVSYPAFFLDLKKMAEHSVTLLD
jgi:3-phosphoshikimate 1-carboxyvinyltransferase